MILHKFWSALFAQINKVANLFWEADPVAQMRYEYDRAVRWFQENEGKLSVQQQQELQAFRAEAEISPQVPPPGP